MYSRLLQLLVEGEINGESKAGRRRTSWLRTIENCLDVVQQCYLQLSHPMPNSHLDGQPAVAEEQEEGEDGEPRIAKRKEEYHFFLEPSLPISLFSIHPLFNSLPLVSVGKDGSYTSFRGPVNLQLA